MVAFGLAGRWTQAEAASLAAEGPASDPARLGRARARLGLGVATARHEVAWAFGFPGWGRA